MQSQGRTDSLENLPRQHGVSFPDIGKLVGAIALGASCAIFTTHNLVAIMEVQNRFQCGQTMQEVGNDHYKEHPAIYHLLSPGRTIGGSLFQPNPHRDERCFKDGEYVGVFPYSPPTKS